MKYEDYKNLIFKLCWDFKKRNPNIEFEDLLGEANITFLRCQKTFIEGKKFSTYLYKSIKNNLLNYTKRRKKIETIELTENITNHSDFTFFELSENSKKTIQILKEYPINTKMEVIKILKNNFNFSHKEIQFSFAEIKEFLYKTN